MDTEGAHAPWAEGEVEDRAAAAARPLVLVGERMEADQLALRASVVAQNRVNMTCSRVPVWHGRSDCGMDLDDIAVQIRAGRETAAQRAA